MDKEKLHSKNKLTDKTNEKTQGKIKLGIKNERIQENITFRFE